MSLRSGSAFAVLALLSVAGCGDQKAAAPAGDTAATPIAPPAGQDWTQMMAATPEGGFRVGNPDARVKLVEFASMTCPHCREFHEEANAVIKSKYVASGNVSYEYRSFVLNGPDYAASLLARCGDAPTFFGLLDAFYADQATWTEPFSKLTDAQSKTLGAMPQDEQIKAMAELGGLDGFVRTRGIPKAKFDQCLADKGQLDKLLELRTQATDTYKLTGTPGFIINGTTQDGVFTWKELEPRLQAALR
ncbi:thioredoxin domain-containing protein [Sandarakinorhabdus sp.]|uniref:thioredoxin domain-containing protein n=1 Tax=Sandarakinorhabdus sp. TaxID=1916663 RepID=UPI00286E62A4|nr:thioredoxin domain-containing protein [Sandarakinorhabdus sp.]